jgi:hypothetical protein
MPFVGGGAGVGVDAPPRPARRPRSMSAALRNEIILKLSSMYLVSVLDYFVSLIWFVCRRIKAYWFCANWHWLK